MTSWDEISPGMTITVQRRHRRRPFRIVVDKVEATGTRGYRLVVGQRLTAGGTPSTRRTQVGLSPNQRSELVHIDDVLLTTR